MSASAWRTISTALLFIVIFASGYWLSRSGKPYNTLLLTVHKLISVGAFVFLVIILIRAARADSLGAAEGIAGGISGVLFLSLIATGGLLSSDLETAAVVSIVHRIAPYLTILSTAATLFLL
jgi:hypothetical protein